MLKGLKVLLPILLLSGCASSPQDCDPANRDAGLLDKAGCLYGGHYQQRQQERQGILQDEQNANRLFQEAFEILQQESRQVTEDLSSWQASLQRVNASLENMLANIRQQTADNQQIRQQADAIENRLRQLQADLDAAREGRSTLSTLQRRQQMAELQLKVEDLQAAVGLH